MSEQTTPQMRIGQLSKSIEDEIIKLVDWMRVDNIMGSVFDISDKWSEHIGMGKHDHKFYRRMSTLLKIAHEKGLVEFEWKASKSPIPKKHFRVSPKPIRKKHEHDTKQETRLMLGYQLNPNISFSLMGFSDEENGTDMRNKNLYLRLY